MIASVSKLIDVLPIENIGACILKKDGSTLYTGSVEQLKNDLAAGSILFHRGSIGGAWPNIV